jgi:transposase
MSYSTDYRKRVIEYRKEGHTLEETKRTFKVSISTIRSWERLNKEQGTPAKRALDRRYKKINPDELKAHVKANPDAYQTEIAEVFGCTESAIRKAFRRLGITRKKRRSVTGNKTL